MSVGDSAKQVLLIVQLAFLGLCVVLGIYLLASGARPAKAPEMRVTVTAEEKQENCFNSAYAQPEGFLQDNALQTCAEINFTDTLEPINP
jgi:hypothetical protein